MPSPLQDIPQNVFRRRKGILEFKKANERTALSDISGIVKPLSVLPFPRKVRPVESISRNTIQASPFDGTPSQTEHGLSILHGTSILLYRHDGCLLNTRQLVLEHAGFAVHASQSFSEALTMILSKCPALLILSHSLPSEDCEHLLRLLAPERIGPERRRTRQAAVPACSKLEAGTGEQQTSAFATYQE